MKEFDELLRHLRKMHAGYYAADPATGDPPCLAWWIAGHDTEELG